MNLLAVLCDGSTDKSITEQEVVYVILTDSEKIVFLSSDRASVNCGNSGLIKLFQEDYPSISFIWCFSHELELAIKDALKEYMELVDTMLTQLYYLYSKSSRKHHKLQNLYDMLMGEFEMYTSGIRPVKATGTRWIDQKLWENGEIWTLMFSLKQQHFKYYRF